MTQHAARHEFDELKGIVQRVWSRKRKRQGSEAIHFVESYSKEGSDIVDNKLASMICPITRQMMRDPVVLCDGHSYERTAIREWFGRGRDTSPVTGLRLKNLHLTPNVALRKAVEDAAALLSDSIEDQRATKRAKYHRLSTRLAEHGRFPVRCASENLGAVIAERDLSRIMMELERSSRFDESHCILERAVGLVDDALMPYYAMLVQLLATRCFTGNGGCSLDPKRGVALFERLASSDHEFCATRSACC
jgi:hypothetical protein